MARTYRRYSTRLRFEPWQVVPQAGDSWIAMTELGHVRVKVHLLKVKRVFEHSGEPGVMLMDAEISRSEVR